jgi:hypothetical protein
MIASESNQIAESPEFWKSCRQTRTWPLVGGRPDLLTTRAVWPNFIYKGK